jgi:adenosylcobinamide-phosphate synthase
VRWTGRNFDAGKPTTPGWCGACRCWCRRCWWRRLPAGRHYSLLLALAFDVLLLYLTLGFRQFSHYFTDIRDALDRGDETEARRLLAEWRHLDASELPRTELLRHVIEHALLAAHRMSSACSSGSSCCRRWAWGRWARCCTAWPSSPAATGATATGAGRAGQRRLLALSQRLFALIDHVPARLTAFGFAVVGNFEEAIRWRRDAGCGSTPTRA